VSETTVHVFLLAIPVPAFRQARGRLPTPLEYNEVDRFYDRTASLFATQRLDSRFKVFITEPDQNPVPEENSRCFLPKCMIQIFD
jgi:hypothetical protein